MSKTIEINGKTIPLELLLAMLDEESSKPNTVSVVPMADVPHEKTCWESFVEFWGCCCAATQKYAKGALALAATVGEEIVKEEISKNTSLTQAQKNALLSLSDTTISTIHRLSAEKLNQFIKENGGDVDPRLTALVALLESSGTTSAFLPELDKKIKKMEKAEKDKATAAASASSSSENKITAASKEGSSADEPLFSIEEAASLTALPAAMLATESLLAENSKLLKGAKN
jgi:hypothetical protein